MSSYIFLFISVILADNLSLVIPIPNPLSKDNNNFLLTILSYSDISVSKFIIKKYLSSISLIAICKTFKLYPSFSHSTSSVNISANTAFHQNMILIVNYKDSIIIIFNASIWKWIIHNMFKLTLINHF